MGMYSSDDEKPLDGYCFGATHRTATYYALGIEGAVEYQDSKSSWHSLLMKQQKRDVIGMILKATNQSLHL